MDRLTLSYELQSMNKRDCLKYAENIGVAIPDPSVGVNAIRSIILDEVFPVKR